MRHKELTVKGPTELGESIEIGLPSWIIQDGNYKDFRVGDTVKFAVELRPTTVERTKSIPFPIVKRIGPAKYQGIALVLSVRPEVWVLDIGICAYIDSPPAVQVAVGDYLSVDFVLGVDPYFYSEVFARLSDFPAMIYTWRVQSILIETAPFVERDHKFVRDPAKLCRRAITETDAQNDDNGNGDYVLVCQRLACPALSAMTR